MSFNNTNTDILIAGAFAAFSVDLLVYPLDTIKTRLQSPEYRKRYTSASSGAVNRSLFRGLYQGIGSVILATVPSCKYHPQPAPSPDSFRLTPSSRSLLHNLRGHQDPSLLYPASTSHKPLYSVRGGRTCLMLYPNPGRGSQTECPNGLPPSTPTQRIQKQDLRW